LNNIKIDYKTNKVIVNYKPNGSKENTREIIIPFAMDPKTTICTMRFTPEALQDIVKIISNAFENE